MMGKTHAAAGGLFAAALLPPSSAVLGLDFGPAELACGVGIGVVAGLLPDIDHPNSMITAGVVPGSKFLGPLGRPLGFFLSLPPRIIGAGARTQLKHRGGTHSALFMVLWTVLAAPIYGLMIAAGAFLLATVVGLLAAVMPFLPQINPNDTVRWLIENMPSAMPLIMLSVFWGYLSHLLADSMTNVPVPWPWPFSKKRYSILPKGLRITTDSFTENALIRPLVIVLLAGFVFLHIILPVGLQVADTIGGEEEKVEKIKERESGKKNRPNRTGSGKPRAGS